MGTSRPFERLPMDKGLHQIPEETPDSPVASEFLIRMHFFSYSECCESPPSPATPQRMLLLASLSLVVVVSAKTECNDALAGKKNLRLEDSRVFCGSRPSEPECLSSYFSSKPGDNDDLVWLCVWQQGKCTAEANARHAGKCLSLRIVPTAVPETLSHCSHQLNGMMNLGAHGQGVYCGASFRDASRHRRARRYASASVSLLYD